MATQTQAGNLGSNNAQVLMDVADTTAISATVTGTFTATLTFQILYDTAEGWVAAPCYTRAGAPTTNSLTAPGNRFIDPKGAVAVRALMTPYTSGSAECTFSGSPAIGVAAGGGGGGGGAVTVADGADVTQGAIADASVVGDTAGTLSAKLRGLTRIFGDVWNSANHYLTVGLATTLNEANDTVSGHIGGFSKVVNLVLTRPANVTPYTAGDEITDFNGTLAQRTFAGCARVAGGSGVITGAVDILSDNPATLPSLKLYVFDTDPSTAGDNAPWAPSDAQLATALGVINLSGGEIGTTGTTGNVFFDSGPVQIPFTCLGGTTNLYFNLVTRTAFTAGASSSTHTLRLRLEQN